MSTRALSFFVLVACAVLSIGAPISRAEAGVLRDKLMEKRMERQQAAQQAERPAMEDDEAGSTQQHALPAGIRRLSDVAYGNSALQTMDVYLPADTHASVAKNMPVIFMVHGGAWKIGDKSAAAVVTNKIKRWVPQGVIFISVNYRMLPQARPLQQAEDVASALAFAQSRAADWGGDRQKFVLFGHSAGAHLVALLASSPEISAHAGAGPWLGTVALDSAAYDVNEIMSNRHYRFYDEAFGSDPAYWRANSPLIQLTQAGAPFLAVCSSLRPDHPCVQAEHFVNKAHTLGMSASLLPQKLNHLDINQRLGQDSDYTASVENFLRSLDASLRQRLSGNAGAVAY